MFTSQFFVPCLVTQNFVSFCHISFYPLNLFASFQPSSFIWNWLQYIPLIPMCRGQKVWGSSECSMSFLLHHIFSILSVCVWLQFCFLLFHFASTWVCRCSGVGQTSFTVTDCIYYLLWPSAAHTPTCASEVFVC